MVGGIGASVALGQVLALLIAVTASTSTALANQGVSLPTLQSTANYLLLAAVYSFAHAQRKEGSPWLSKPWWQYAILAAMDVEANFLLVTAYRYTSITSVILIDCMSIPLAVILTRVCLKSMYRKGHYAGAATCIAGVCLLVVSDDQLASLSTDGDGRSAALFGDVLVVLGASLYAMSNVFQEYLLDDVPINELLMALGMFGTLFSTIQFIPLELSTALTVTWTKSAVLCFWLFGLSLFTFYSLVPFELQIGGAAILNLSLLAADLWTGLARLLIFGGYSLSSGLSFLVSFLVVAAGIALYVASGDVKTAAGEETEEGSAVVYQPVGWSAAPQLDIGGDTTLMGSSNRELLHNAAVAGEERKEKDVELGSSPSFAARQSKE